MTGILVESKPRLDMPNVDSNISKADPRHENENAFTIIGHRGAAGLAPENTLGSFATALQLGCPMLELDVHLARDDGQGQQLVVIHDEQLQRTTNGNGPVNEYTVAELKELDAGDGAQIPLLTEVTDLIRKHNEQRACSVCLNIELKGEHTAAPVAAFLQDNPDLDVLVSSFQHRELAHFRMLDPATAVAPLYDRYDSAWHETAKKLGASAVNISTRIATAKRISEIRSAGYSVYVYTVNRARLAVQLKGAGASGVFTDRPDLMFDAELGPCAWDTPASLIGGEG